MKGMSLSAMAKACNGIYHGNEEDKDKVITNITTDSRTVEEGSLFIAIKGAKSDGHDYIESCYEKGALCCLSEKKLEGIDKPYIQVNSSLQALKDLAEYYRSNLNVKVVGITGSVGKTSTKETIASVLEQKYKVLKTNANFNNEIGLPLTVFRLREDDEVAVLEMGISDFGEMTRLTKIAKPDICVITNIGICHLENLKDRDGILRAKTEIFKSMNPDGSVILNGDDDKLITVSEVYGKKPVFFGIENKDANIHAGDVKNLGLDGMSCTMYGLDAENAQEGIEINIPVAGYHMVYNAMAAAAVGKELGLTTEQIKNGIKNLKTISGRNNILKGNGYTVIDDCYNANPVSMKASIDVIDTAIGRKVCILGDMFELGENEKQLHYEVGEYLAGKSVDVLITVGELSKMIAKGVSDIQSKQNNISCKIYSYDTKDALFKELSQLIQEGDNILVKASHGMNFTEIIKKLLD